MTKKEELQSVIKDGMVVEFNDNTLGIYLGETIITVIGGRPLKDFNDTLSKGGINSFYVGIKKVFTLKPYDYCADIFFWLESKKFMNHIDRIIWQCSPKPTVQMTLEEVCTKLKMNIELIQNKEL